ncbi:hypothetical protein ACOSKC_000095 [Providencia stuartii]
MKWRLGVKGSQYDAGMRSENHQINMPLLERKEGDDTLHIHFYQKIKLN